MFKFLKNKLKDAVDSFSSKAQEEAQEVTSEELTQEEQEQLAQESQESLEVQEVQESPVKEATKEIKEEFSEDVAEEKFVEQPEEKIEEQTEPEEASQDEQTIESVSEEEIPQEKKGFFKRMFKKKSCEDVEEQEPKDDSQEEQNSSEDLVKEQSGDIQEDTPQEVISEESPQEPQEQLSQESKESFDELSEPLPQPEQLIEAEVALAHEEEQASQKPVQEEQPEDVVAEQPEPEEVTEEKIAVALEIESKKEAVHEELLQEAKDSTKKKKGFFKKVTEKIKKFQLTDESFEELFWDFELALLENNVALEVIEKIKSDLKESLTQERVSRKTMSELIIDSLKKSLDEILDVETFDLLEKVKSKKPFVISIVGVNGSGKTTTLAKLIHLFQKNNLSVVVAAADTFRAAAIQQLEEHTTKLGVKLIKHDYEADPSAVAFDAIKHAQAKGIDVVLIDTAGRLQSNTNLMGELEKLVRVNKPDLSLFVGESITGNDCVEQAVAFNKVVGIDGIILSKADVDEKGGAAISVSYVTKKPILYLGVGQTYDDLVLFEKSKILDELGL